MGKDRWGDRLLFWRNFWGGALRRNLIIIVYLFLFEILFGIITGCVIFLCRLIYLFPWSVMQGFRTSQFLDFFFKKNNPWAELVSNINIYFSFLWKNLNCSILTKLRLQYPIPIFNLITVRTCVYALSYMFPACLINSQ